MSNESHDIWKHFQHRFTLINDLGKYKKFFKEIMHEVLSKCAQQNIFVVELRHMFGMLFEVVDGEKKNISVEEELKLIQEVVDHIRKDVPHFELKLITCGLKIVGRPHIQKQIGFMLKGEQLSDLVTGFDLVNEEDFTPPILDFINEIMEGRQRDSKQKMPCFFHCGESHDRNNQNIVEAIMTDSMRIGHGFQLFLHPYYQQLVREKDICIEACPVSNMLLGYVVDLRSHPVRFLLQKNLQVSISSDDPGFFGYDGVTMDYVLATLAWQLDLRDLKKLSLNGIKYASISEAKKKHLTEEVFPKKWKEFIQLVNEKY